MTRTFVAIELGAEVRARLTREMARLGLALPWVRWVDPASLHLTLAFLGELDDAQLAAVYDAAAEAAPRVSPFALSLGSLARLHEALAVALEARGFARDARPFAAHLTLARLRTPPTPEQAARLRALVRAESPRAEASAASAALAVRELSVMRSELSRPAARYTCLRALPLGAR